MKYMMMMMMTSILKLFIFQIFVALSCYLLIAFSIFLIKSSRHAKEKLFIDLFDEHVSLGVVKKYVTQKGWVGVSHFRYEALRKKCGGVGVKY